jgi:hypothetical protein
MINNISTQSEQYPQNETDENNPQKICFSQYFFPYIMLSGYDFRDKFLNCWLVQNGDPLVQLFTASQHFNNFSRDGKPIVKNCAANVHDNMSVIPEAVEVETPLPDEKATSLIDRNSGIPLIAESFRMGYTILLAAFSGVGKTFLAIYATLVAFQKGYITSAAFFNLEDTDGKQKPRFDEMFFGFELTLISPQELETRKAQIKQNSHMRAGVKADFFLKNPLSLKWWELYKKSLGEENLTLTDKRQINYDASSVCVGKFKPSLEAPS